MRKDIKATVSIKVTEGHQDMVGKTYTLLHEKDGCYSVKGLEGISLVDTLEEIDLILEKGKIGEEVKSNVFLHGYDELKFAEYIIVKFIKFH